MQRTLLKSKIHRATVTDADLHYQGSLTIDRALMDAAEILEYEQVDVVNVNTGARFTTYAIPGAPGSGTICLNGAAARLAQRGDLVIIMTYGTYADDEAKRHSPILVFVDEKNRAKAV